MDRLSDLPCTEGMTSHQPPGNLTEASLTILRCSWFDQNFSENYLLEPILDGLVESPAGSVAEPFGDADDIADVAVAALTDGRHAGQLYELTGPRLLTFADAVAEIGRAFGRSIRYVPVSPRECSAAQGVPDAVIALLATCSPRYSTAGTPTSPTAFSAHLAGHRVTSRTTPVGWPARAGGSRPRRWLLDESIAAHSDHPGGPGLRGARGRVRRVLHPGDEGARAGAGAAGDPGHAGDQPRGADPRIHGPVPGHNPALRAADGVVVPVVGQRLCSAPARRRGHLSGGRLRLDGRLSRPAEQRTGRPRPVPGRLGLAVDQPWCLTSRCPRKLIGASRRNARERGGQLALIRMPLRTSGRAVGTVAR